MTVVVLRFTGSLTGRGPATRDFSCHDRLGWQGSLAALLPSRTGSFSALWTPNVSVEVLHPPTPANLYQPNFLLPDTLNPLSSYNDRTSELDGSTVYRSLPFAHRLSVNTLQIREAVLPDQDLTRIHLYSQPAGIVPCVVASGAAVMASDCIRITFGECRRSTVYW